VSLITRLFGRKAGKVKDPVCGMAVDPAGAQWVSTHAGESFYFCGRSCKDAFDAEPGKYVSPGAASAP